jgi:dipeptidyl-peptidase-4
MAALQKQSAPFDLMAYPGAAHGIRGRENQLHVFSTITRFFERELRP